MGKNSGNSWLNAVKKAFRSPIKDNHDKRSNRRREEETEQEEEEEEKKRGKRRWIFRKPLAVETTIQHNAAKNHEDNPPPITNICGEGNLLKKEEEKKSAIAMALATAEVAVAKAKATVEIIRLKGRSSFLFKEDNAALVIQTFFRGYLARRALLALKGVVKLQALIRGHNVRKRAKMTLQCIQSLVRVQAQVCDQRRRLSYESTSLGPMFSHANCSRNSMSRTESNPSNELDDYPLTLEEIQALIHKVKECSIKHGKTLAHALSNQMWESDGDQFSDSDYKELIQQNKYSGRKKINQWSRKDKALCYQRDQIKNFEIDTSRPYTSHKLQNHHSDYEQYLDPYTIPSPLHKKHDNIRSHSPKASSPSKIKSIYLHSSSPNHQTEERKYHTAETPNLRSNYIQQMSMSQNSCPVPRPNYMAATASAMARLRSCSAPRQRAMSPYRDQAGSAKKRLSFPFLDGQDADDHKDNGLRYTSVHARGVGFEERSSNVSSCCTEQD